MKCNDVRCRGEIDFENHTYTKTRSGLQRSFPCKKCGLLHSANGDNFFLEETDQVVYLKNGEQVCG